MAIQRLKCSDLKGDFKIYAFKGTPKYDAFYGRISSDIISGLIGEEKIISDDKLTKARNDIADKLKKDLIAKAQDTKPLGYDLLPGSYFIQNENEDDNNTEVDSWGCNGSGAHWSSTPCGHSDAKR